MNCLVLISCCWLLKKTLIIPTNLTNPESASECTSFEEQKGARYIWRNVYFGITVFSCLSSKNLCLRFLLICFAREIKGFYQSSLENEVNFKGIMNVPPNILTKNWNFKKLRHGFVDERALIITTLTSSCPWKTLVPYCLRKKRPGKNCICNTNSELSQNRAEVYYILKWKYVFCSFRYLRFWEF